MPIEEYLVPKLRGCLWRSHKRPKGKPEIALSGICRLWLRHRHPAIAGLVHGITRCLDVFHTHHPHCIGHADRPGAASLAWPRRAWRAAAARAAATHITASRAIAG